VLVFLSTAMGWLDFERVYVNPTHLWPGIVGGLIMGVGFIIGGFCPGTSVVATSTLKIDGLFFLTGVTLGIFAFGETVGLYERFWNSSDLGRFTLPELFGVDAGVVMLGVVAMALFMFLLAEVLEGHFGRGLPAQSLRFFPRRPAAWGFGAALLAVAGLAALRGQPSADRRWELVAADNAAKLETRAVYADPREVAELAQDTGVYTRILDLRSEAHYNLFHPKHAVNLSPNELRDPAILKSLRALPANTAVFTLSNDEAVATEGWRLLVAEGVQNVYIVEGGINGWLTTFPPLPCLAEAKEGPRKPESLAFTFFRAVGDCCDSARPEISYRRLPFDCYLSANPASPGHSAAGVVATPAAAEFEHKVKLTKRAVVKGGCG
jgi:rhodanese-related sulfurtransferase